MADYHHTRGGLHYRQATAKARDEHPGHAAAIWSGIGLLILAAFAWMWLRQAPASSPLPSSAPPLAEAPLTATIDSSTPAKALVVQVVKVSPPASIDEAAVGDTRAAQP